MPWIYVKDVKMYNIKNKNSLPNICLNFKMLILRIIVKDSNICSLHSMLFPSKTNKQGSSIQGHYNLQYMDHLPTSPTSHWWRTWCTCSSSITSHSSPGWLWGAPSSSVVSCIWASFFGKTWVYKSSKKQHKEINDWPKCFWDNW